MLLPGPDWQPKRQVRPETIFGRLCDTMKGDVVELDGFQYENISFQEDLDGLIHVKVDSEPLFDIARKGTKWIGVYKRPKRPEVYMDLHDFVECLLFYLMRKEHSMKDWRLFTGFSRA